MKAIRLRRPYPQVRDAQRGQGLVEFAMLVPVFLLILLGLLEFGYVFDHTMTLSYATREGARSGAAFAAGSATLPCANVDAQIVAAVERVLEAPGSQVVAGDIENVRIYLAATNGTEVGPANEWTYNKTSKTFVFSSGNWSACDRDNTWGGPGDPPGTPPDSIGISIRYTYTFVTPLSAVMGFFGPPGGAGMTITDRSVMALNPTN